MLPDDCRLSNELITDVATLYEMPDEAVQWVNHMVQYTVAGGKMNRGLTVLAATKSMAKAYGRDDISPKVRRMIASKSAHYVDNLFLP